MTATPSTPRPRILSLATEVPEHELETRDVIEEARLTFAHRQLDFERLSPVFTNTGINRRYSGRPFSWFRSDKGWPERSEAYIEEATKLFRRATLGALAAAGLQSRAVDAIVTVSSTGIATPTLEARVLDDLGFREDVHRVPVFGLGCAGGVSGLAIAGRLATAEPGSIVLLVVIELCTLAFRRDELTKANIIATALFGDGAGAAILSTEGATDIGSIEHAGEHTWPQSLDVMGWRIDPVGFGAIFSRSIPDIVTSSLKPAADAFLGRHGLEEQDIGQFVFHPGGAKVIQALESTFGLPQGTLAIEREVLRDYGNMSAATVLFVLDRARQTFLSGRRFLSALGPGFTASFLTMVA